jgi:hypothetical protein
VIERSLSPTRGDPAAYGRLTLLPPLLLGAALVCVVAMVVMAVGALSGSDFTPAFGEAASGGAEAPSAFARADIPPTYLRLYQLAGARYGVDWALLAGIGKVECDHGRDPDPSCTREGSVNAAGAGGPMQFLASTWARYGVDADGGGHGDRWNAADAILGAANYMRASGAPGDDRAALLAYNHAGWYADEVQRWAARYRGGPTAIGTGPAGAVLTSASSSADATAEGADAALASETSTRVIFIAGASARLDPIDGHLAMIPTGVPATVQAMLVAGNELQDLPYGPGGHPDPRGAAEEDCSSTVNYVLYRAGVRPIAEVLARNPLAQDYVSWGVPGPGRWVTIYAADSPTPHVFITIAGLRLDTSHDGTDVGPNRYQDGPRWRVYPSIPAWAAWSVRHPPGL